MRALMVAAAIGALALAALALCACGPSMPSNREVDPPPGADDALAISVQEWSERLPEAAGLDAEAVPPIVWFEGRCLDYDWVEGDACVHGHTQWGLWGEEIHLATSPTLHQSALAHELLHWALNESAGEWDGDHSADAWGAPLDDVKLTLSLAGL